MIGLQKPVAIRYRKLIEFIKTGYGKSPRLKKSKLKKLIISEYPDLWLEVRTGRVNGGGVSGLNVQLLYKTLGITFDDKCLNESCGKTTRIPSRGLYPAEHCDIQCSRKSSRTHQRYSATRKISEKNRLSFKVEDLSKIYSKLRLKILEAQVSDLHTTRRSFTRHIRKCYPELYEKVRRHSGINLEKLFECLDIPLTSSCLHCGAKTGLCLQGISYHRFCSLSCRTLFYEPDKRKRHFAKYGVFTSMQRPEVLEKQQKTTHRIHHFTSMSGLEYPYQGYEIHLLRRLDKNKDVSSFDTQKSAVPRILYTVSNKKKFYYPDIEVRLRNGRRLVVEVKSLWTLKDPKNMKMNIAKFKQAFQESVEQGFEFWILVVNDFSKKFTWYQENIFSVMQSKPQLRDASDLVTR